MTSIRSVHLVFASSAFFALLVSKSTFADTGDDTLRVFLSKADLVVAGELLSEPVKRRSELGVVNISFELRVANSIKGDVPEDRDLRVRIVRYERVAGDELPWLRKGAKAILFLRNPRPGGRMGSVPVSADMWFGVQRMNRKMQESLKRLAAEAKADE